MLQRADDVSGRILDLSEMRECIDGWASLCQNLAEENVYYSPRYALALLGSLKGGKTPVFVTAWRKGELIGILPLVRDRIAFSGIMPSGSSWQSPYTFSCMPLLERNFADEAASALVKQLSHLGEHDWALHDIYPDGEAGIAFRRVLDAEGLAWHTYGHYERAWIRHGQSYDELLETHVPAKRRRDLRRNRKRLEKVGALRHEAHESGDGLARGVEIFLDLEKSGWKGRRGTALASNHDTLEFARQAMVTDGNARTRVDLLFLDERPVAAGVIVFCGGTGFTIKGAYDEEFRNYSVGLLLELEVVKSFLEEKWADRLDSATAGDHVIDFIWPNKKTVANFVFSTNPRKGHSHLVRYERSAQLYARAKGLAKRLLGR